MEHLIRHYKPQTIEIAERFKFFKRHELGGESTTDFMTELRCLAKTCNFGNCLESAIRDQFGCGLHDIKTQREILCISELTAQIALRKTCAAETVYKETQTMKDNAETLSISTAKVCYRCGKTDHGAATCKYKTAKCHACQKIGHLARVCRAKNKNNQVTKTDSKQAKVDMKKSKDKVHQLETVPSETDVTGSSGEDDHLHNILQLGDKSAKFLFTATINGVDVEMELDSGADRSTVPWELFQKRLAGVCKLVPTSVTLYQYDKSHLKTKGQCKVTVVQVLGRKIGATLIVVDVKHQVPLFGRDWMVSFGLDLPTMLTQTLQVCHVTSNTAVIESLKSEFSDVFKEELGVLHGIEATIELKPTAVPRFCKNRPVPFALKEKIETLLRSQVDQGELRPVDKSEWVTLIVVVPKKKVASVYVVILKLQLTLSFALKYSLFQHQRRCLALSQMVSPLQS